MVVKLVKYYVWASVGNKVRFVANSKYRNNRHKPLRCICQQKGIPTTFISEYLELVTKGTHFKKFL